MGLWASVTPKIVKNGFQNYETGNVIFYGRLSAFACVRACMCDVCACACVCVWCVRACGVWCVCGVCACAVCVCVWCACERVRACVVCVRVVCVRACMCVWCVCGVFLPISCETNGQILTQIRNNTALLSSPLVYSLCPTINNPNKVNMRCSEEGQ